MNDFNFDFIGGLTDFRGAGRKWHSKDLMEFCFWPDYTLMFITSGKMAKQKD